MTTEAVRRLLDYNFETGIFKWKVRLGRAQMGSVAGTIYKNGRRYITISRKRYFAAHLAWLITTGEWPTSLIDHKNTNKADDRFENLRLATRSLNSANQNLHKDNRLGVKGVVAVKRILRPPRYRARIRVDGRLIHLGYFDTSGEAHDAYANAAKQHFGEFARPA